MKAVILGSDRGIRYVDSSKSYPTALLPDKRGNRLLDWILESLNQAKINDIAFVGGYHIEKVVQSYSCLRFYYNPEWKRGNVIQSLRCASSELDDDCVLVPSDVIFRKEAIERLVSEKGDVRVGIGGKGKGHEQIAGRSFSGLIAISAQAASGIARRINDPQLHKGEKGSLDFISFLEGEGLTLRYIDIDGHWAKVESSNSLSRFVFGTKAKTLERLRPVVKEAEILDQIRFTVKEWNTKKESILDHIQSYYRNSTVIVRSSAVSEDSWIESMAGEFLSVGNVKADHRDALNEGINSVIRSFEKDINLDNEVFVQRNLTEVDASGVIFTRDPETRAPYILINYDSISKRTDTVTNGCGVNLKTAIIYKFASNNYVANPQITRLLKLIRELEELLENDCLDIEFAFDEGGTCYLLQVRPLVANRNKISINDDDFGEEIATIKAYIDWAAREKPLIAGKKTLFANMPDWNPAELVGVSPRPLALSLFQRIISEKTWAEARTAINYTDVSHEPLIVSFGWHPYVDVRTSFNSFVPATLPDSLREKLVDYYIRMLEDRPECHDKVEFEIVISCLDLNFRKHGESLRKGGFTDGEIETLKGSLLRLTDDVVCGRVAPIEDMLRLVEKLEMRREKVVMSDSGNPFAVVRCIRLLLDDCMRFGTFPFCILARYAFISVAFLNSLAERGVLSPGEIASVRQSMPSVASEIAEDFDLLSSDLISKEEFLNKYGHLRPGTYDIFSQSYAENPDFYLANFQNRQPRSLSPTNHSVDQIFQRHATQIDAQLQNCGFTFGWKELANFIRSSIPAREKLKFEYTKNLSLILCLLEKFGNYMDLSKDDIAYIPISVFLDLSVNSPSSHIRSELTQLVNRNKKKHVVYRSIRLPHIINSVEDVDHFDLLEWRPNFITDKAVIGTVVEISGSKVESELEGKIVFIENADPGYDWIFGCCIRGLVTKYGGAASHMAIRAAELDLPAAIGCGDLIYNNVRTASVIELDCASQQLRIIR